ncbi:MAG: FAD-binding oxidoreductase [Woeseia sp.]|nr:FAD-binding oxidoreductase [Woeseia sp.]MBT8098074.1 FAD-binding oxidoreductase [Woeseia sp.]NNE60974.1 FAD-binding oxidoreductase [Woeseia sp.]NNL54029.1 FAD-binding oxidoreductase [Woeseia sp.]
MTAPPGYIESYYSATAKGIVARAPLADTVDTDVCIVGGGYTGISAALHLAERGYAVTLLEAERIGWGASGRNGGHVGIGQRKGQAELESMVGKETARTLWQYGLEAVDLIRTRIGQHAIDCDLKDGILHVAAKSSHAEELQQEAEMLQRDYAYEKIRYVEQDELSSMIGTGRFFAGQLDTGSAHLHPLNFVLGLAAAAVAAGASIHEQSRVVKITGGANPVVETAQGRVRCKHLILACNGYLEGLAPSIAGYIMPINNFVLATEPLPDDTARSLIRDDVAVQDTQFVIDYWKLSGDKRLIFGGGENYSRKFPADLKGFVRKFMLKIYPQLSNTRIDYAWGGTLAITMNRLPRFGRTADGVFYAHGYSGHGVPTATFAGQLLAEAVAGTAERFDVMASLPKARFPGGTLLRWPGLVLGMLYYSLRDKF